VPAAAPEGEEPVPPRDVPEVAPPPSPVPNRINPASR